MKYFQAEEDQAILNLQTKSVTFLTQFIQNFDTSPCYDVVIFDQGYKYFP